LLQLQKRKDLFHQGPTRFLALGMHSAKHRHIGRPHEPLAAVRAWRYLPPVPPFASGARGQRR
jgi:hypothetical protein